MRDITYCADKCLNTECPRHITKADGEVSVARLKGTEECELGDCNTCRYDAYCEEDNISFCTHPLLAPQENYGTGKVCIGWMKKP